MLDKACVFTDYLKYRAELRGFDLTQIEHILLYSQERYFDIETHRLIVVGEQGNKLVMIPYEESETEITLLLFECNYKTANKVQINHRQANL